MSVEDDITEIGPPASTGLRTPDNDPALAERRNKAVQLRNAGFTYAQIGKALKISKQRAWALVKDEIAACRTETHETASELRDIAHRRHESLINRLWLKAMPNDPNEVMDLGAADRILRTIAADARIMGYEAPTQHRVDVTQVQMSLQVVVEMICQVLPDELVPKVYEVVEKAAKQLDAQSGRDSEEGALPLLPGASRD